MNKETEGDKTPKKKDGEKDNGGEEKKKRLKKKRKKDKDPGGEPEKGKAGTEKEKEAAMKARAEIDKLTGNFITELGEMIKDPDTPLEVKEECMRAVANTLDSTSKQEKYYEKMLGYQQSRTPEATQPPTIEKAREKLQDETLTKKDKKYERFVRNWFEDRFRHLESVEQTFEEQAVLLEPVMTASSLLELDSDIEIKTLGREMKEEFEARRVRQAMVRIWNLEMPEGISNRSGFFEFSKIRKVFTLRNQEGKAVVAEELRGYERMGQERFRLKEEKGNINKDKSLSKAEKAVKKKEKEKEIRDQERKIIEHYTYGGEIDEGKHKGMRVDQRLVELKEKRKGASVDKQKKIDKEISQLEELVWARRFSGGLFSITGRAAEYDLILNGTGDILTGKISNFSDKLRKDPIYNKTKGIWSPKEGKYKGKPLELGYMDLWTSIARKIRVKADGVDISQGNLEGDPDWKTLDRWGFKEENIKTIKELTKIEDPGGKKPKYEKRDVIDRVVSLENVRFEEEEFWDELESEHGVSKTEYSAWALHLKKSEDTRSSLSGVNSFFHNPSLGGYVALIESFDNHKGEVLIDTGKGEPIAVAAKQVVWQEMLDRVIEYGKTDEGKEVLEQFKTMGSSETFIWIKEADLREMITREQRDLLFKEHLKFPLASAERGAKMRASIALYLSLVRDPEVRGMLIRGTIWEFFKSSFQYILGE